MQLTINGYAVQAGPGQSLRELIQVLNMDSPSLKERPLAAKIAGEVFTLNYIPVRTSSEEQDSTTMRRAMAASNGEIHLLRYSDGPGKKVYTRTACFLLFLAIRALWPDAVSKISCTLGNSVFLSVENEGGINVTALKQKMDEYIREDFPIIRKRISRQEAIAQFRRNDQPDKAELLQ